MKVYEIGTPSHYDEESDDCDCTIWIASAYPIEITEDGNNAKVYIKEIDVDINSFGIDFVIKPLVATE